MANNIRSMPMLVIDTCSTLKDNKELIKPTISSKSNLIFSRSLSLPDYNKAYRDLSGTIHYSSLNHLKNFFIRSSSCPNTKSFHTQSPSVTIQFSMNLLGPRDGTHSPAGSSSRYSLYGSFFNLSENGFHQSVIKTDNRLLCIGGRPLFMIDNTSKSSMNTYRDKCNDWLSHLDTN